MPAYRPSGAGFSSAVPEMIDPHDLASQPRRLPNPAAIDIVNRPNGATVNSHGLSA
jgi:hypothetical protein